MSSGRLISTVGSATVIVPESVGLRRKGDGMNIEYSKVTAEDVLRYIDRTHPVGGKGNCLCSICEAYGIICHAVGKIQKRREEVRKEIAKANQEVAA